MKYRDSILWFGLMTLATGVTGALGTGCARDDVAVSTAEITSGQLAAQPSSPDVAPSEQNQSGPRAGAQVAAYDALLTQEILKAVSADDTLSQVAKSVRVTSEGGRVRLQGRVESERERHTIARKALYLAGIGNVKDELDVQNP